MKLYELCNKDLYLLLRHQLTNQPTNQTSAPSHLQLPWMMVGWVVRCTHVATLANPWSHFMHNVVLQNGCHFVLRLLNYVICKYIGTYLHLHPAPSPRVQSANDRHTDRRSTAAGGNNNIYTESWNWGTPLHANAT